MKPRRKLFILLSVVLVTVARIALLFEARWSHGVLSWTSQSFLGRWFGGHGMVYGSIHVKGKTYQLVKGGAPPYFFHVPELNVVVFTYLKITDNPYSGHQETLHVSYLNGDFADEEHDPKYWGGHMGIGEYSDKIHFVDKQTLLLQRDSETPPAGQVLHLKKSAIHP